MPSPRIEYIEVAQNLEIEDKSLKTDSNVYAESCLAKRYLIAAMLFIGFMITTPLRGSLVIAIVDMTSNKTVKVGNQTTQYGPEFDWDSKKKGLIFSMTSYGPLFSLLSGYMVNKIGGCTSFGIGVSILAILSISVPYALRISFYLFLAMEFVEGFLGDVLHCSIPQIWSKWSPLNERSKLMSLSFAGLFLGIVIAFPFCGFLIHNWGWQSSFYVTGAIALVWAILWMFFINNEPSTTERILSKGQSLKLEEKGTSKEKESFSWKLILKCIPVWMLFLSSCTYAMGFVLIMIYFPAYVKDMTNINIQDIGLLSALPNAANVILFPIIGCLADYIQNKKILTSTQVHKLFMCTGFFCGGILLMIAALVPNFIVSVICLILFRTVMLFASISIKLLPVYIAPEFPSIIQSFISYGFSLGNIIGTTSVGFIVTTHSSLEWSLCFVSFGLMAIINAALFFMFASAKAQPLSHKTSPN